MTNIDNKATLNAKYIYKYRKIKIMTLDQYRRENNLSYRALAILLGFKEATMARRWCLPREHNQAQVPSAKNMAKIIEVTNSAVTPNDFYFKRV